jgi:hypothetical protein
MDLTTLRAACFGIHLANIFSIVTNNSSILFDEIDKCFDEHLMPRLAIKSETNKSNAC